MRVTLCVLLAAACALADESRGSKRPYIADAVGNTLPPPSNGPATVGSPVNLLTPDRYEFYTFDESGELVKRLMTLQEIQAIVAAGEEAEGLVTFANDNQPTIAFNFSQPPYTKVHSVVTNVQNVLKAQMEAHKNKPLANPTLDTPDVSDSWSLILPSIFGNTGVDIVPDKTSGSFTTPETETIEFDRINFDENLSKEGSNPIASSTTAQHDRFPPLPERFSPTTELVREVPTTAKPTPKATSTTTTTTSTTTTTTTTTTPKPTTTSTTTKKPTTSTTTTTTTTTTPKPTTTTKKPVTTTTVRPRTTSTTKRATTTTTPKPRTTVSTTKLTTTSKAPPKTTAKPTTAKPTTAKPLTTTRRYVPSSTLKSTENPSTKVQVSSRATSTTEKSSPIYEKISTFVPLSTAAYITERTTRKPIQTTKVISTLQSTTKKPSLPTSTPKVHHSSSTPTKVQPTVTTYKPSISTTTPISSTIKIEDLDKDKASTITTQSVSPSTAISSTDSLSIDKQPSNTANEDNKVPENTNDIKVNEQMIPLFDVAQSISQIASDLGSTNYQPIPTTSDLLDATAMNMDLESKESLELEIPPESKNESQSKIDGIQKENDKFVKISTSNLEQKDDHDNNVTPKENQHNISNTVAETTTTPVTTTPVSTITTSTVTPMDPILSESMDDLLSQVVNQSPQSIVANENKLDDKDEIPTTAKPVESTTIALSHKTDTTSQHTAINDVSSTHKPALVVIENRNKDENLTKTEENLQTIEAETKKEMVSSVLDSDSPIQNNLTKVSSFYVNNDKPIKPMQELQTLSADKHNHLIAVINAPESPAKEHTPAVSTEATPQEEILQKTSSDKVNKIKDEKEDKVVSLPKVDEFKKKIQKVNIDYKEIANERNNSWKLISTVAPPKTNEIPKDKFKTDPESPDKDIVLDVSKENQGLEVTTKDLSEDIAQFTELCNELAFRYWNAVADTIQNKRSFVLSPFSITSMLAMMFMGARGATSGEMNEILKLDDMVTFNPHFTLKNISDSIETTPESGVAISAFIRELYSDRNKGQILTFYKERAQHFYNGHVEEVNFKLISDIIRRRTNLLVKRYTWGKIIEYMKANTITMQPPLAAFSTNIFQTDCAGSSVEGRDGEMYFVVSPNVRQRRLVPVPAVLYKKGFLAGYDPVLDATAAALGNTNSIISTLFLMPGQQGNVVHAEDLEQLEKRLLDSNPSTPAWNRLLRTLLPRIGLELQIPRFSHKSIFNVSSTLKKMGLKDLFDADHADLGGLNGPSKDLYLSDMVQSTTFVTCGEGIIGEQHHIEEYPESIELARRRRTSRWTTGWDEPRDYQRAFHDPHDVGDAMNLPLHLRPRQARLPARNAQPARLKFDRPFLYFVRHNPSGMILYVGRYNPRLLP